MQFDFKSMREKLFTWNPISDTLIFRLYFLLKFLEYQTSLQYSSLCLKYFIELLEKYIVCKWEKWKTGFWKKKTSQIKLLKRKIIKFLKKDTKVLFEQCPESTYGNSYLQKYTARYCVSSTICSNI